MEKENNHRPTRLNCLPIGLWRENMEVTLNRTKFKVLDVYVKKDYYEDNKLVFEVVLNYSNYEIVKKLERFIKRHKEESYKIKAITSHPEYVSCPYEINNCSHVIEAAKLREVSGTCKFLKDQKSGSHCHIYTWEIISDYKEI